MEAAIFYLFTFGGLYLLGRKFKWPFNEIPRDWALLFSKPGRVYIVKERHDRHVIYTSLVLIGTALLLIWFDIQISTMPSHAFVSLSTLWAFIVNVGREGFMQWRGGSWTDELGKKHNNVPFSWRDIRFGTYSGLLTGLILAALIKIFI